MPAIKVVNMSGAEVGTMELSDVLFGAEVNGAVLHAAVRAYLLNQRQGTQSTLTRSEVSGGGRKPWRQKGTGRARQGSTRSPQWTHGGIALGPKPRSYRTNLNKKTKRLALISALTDKFNNGKLIIVDDIKLESYKTKTMVDMFKALSAERKPLVVLPEVDQFVVKSCANIPGAKTCLYNTINVYDILNADTFITTVAAVKMLEEVYA
ncbi:MAG: 50S ribosomal protein L4 [Clostridia bacterium]|jgi:large subunit ribosomal protein L4|nr:50S ribosomal protein L4 [Clostridia bacterium]